MNSATSMGSCSARASTRLSTFDASVPCTHSMHMKGTVSERPKSSTDTMLLCRSPVEMRASSMNIRTNSASPVCAGRMHLMQTSREMPMAPTRSARKMAAIPPWAIFCLSR